MSAGHPGVAAGFRDVFPIARVEVQGKRTRPTGPESAGSEKDRDRCLCSMSIRSTSAEFVNGISDRSHKFVLRSILMENNLMRLNFIDEIVTLACGKSFSHYLFGR